MSYPGPAEKSRMAERYEALRRKTLDVFYPQACRSCKAALDIDGETEPLKQWLCPACHRDLSPVLPPFCDNCGEPFEGAITGSFTCMNCSGRRYAFDFAISRYRAEGTLRELIHSFKYGRDLALRGLLAQLLQEVLEDPRLINEPLADWLIVPVPLHRSRLRHRGFNQSAEISGALSRLTGIPTAEALARVLHTDSQASLHRAERLENLRNAFALRRPWFGRIPDLKKRRILLVDDVLTTGATTHECAKVLKRVGGAEKVVVITVARG